VQRKQHTRIAKGINRAGLYLTIAFFTCEVFSGVFYPVVFAGIPVLHLTEMIPLQWGMPNVAQLFYLAASAIIFMLTITSTREELDTAITWYLHGCITATVIAAYQLSNAIIHVPFPDALIYSNPGHTIYHAYMISGMWRLNSTFTEASDMAGALIPGFAIIGWNLMKNRLRFSNIIKFVAMLSAILMTLSTTGYLCLSLLAAFAAIGCMHHVLSARGANPIKLLLLILILATASTTYILSNSVRTKTYNIISSVILNKRGSESYIAREGSHSRALRTLSDTDYLGAGLGSTRASGMAYTILASSGVPGLALLFLAFLVLCLPIVHPSKYAHPANLELARRTLLGLCLYLTALLLAGSEPIGPVLWLLFGAALVYPGYTKPEPSKLPLIYPWLQTGQSPIFQQTQLRKVVDY
jgi:hypothetical protein